MARIIGRTLFATLLVLALAVVPAAAQPSPDQFEVPIAELPGQTGCVPWPTAGWPTGDLPEGVDPAAVDELLGRMVGPEGGDSVVVIHGGMLVAERYGEGITPETLQPSFSVSKSIAATLVGMLHADGVLDIDQPLAVPQWSGADDPRAGITVRHLLTMTSGLAWNEAYGGDSDVVQLVRSADTASFVISRPAAAEPGTTFHYSTGDTTMVGHAIAQATGVSGASYDTLLQRRIFEPLGMVPTQPAFD